MYQVVSRCLQLRTLTDEKNDNGHSKGVEPDFDNRNDVHPSTMLDCRSGNPSKEGKDTSEDVDTKHSTYELPRRPYIRCSSLLRQPSDDYQSASKI